MSDIDEHGNRVPDNDEIAEAYEQRRRNRTACQCGTDLPGTCPGPAACPYSDFHEDEEP